MNLLLYAILKSMITNNNKNINNNRVGKVSRYAYKYIIYKDYIIFLSVDQSVSITSLVYLVTFTHIYSCTCACTHARTHIHTNKHLYICIYVCMYNKVNLSCSCSLKHVSLETTDKALLSKSISQSWCEKLLRLVTWGDLLSLRLQWKTTIVSWCKKLLRLETWGDLLSLRLQWKTTIVSWCKKLLRLETWGDLLSLRLQWKTTIVSWCKKLLRLETWGDLLSLRPQWKTTIVS